MQSAKGYDVLSRAPTLGEAFVLDHRVVYGDVQDLGSIDTLTETRMEAHIALFSKGQQAL